MALLETRGLCKDFRPGTRAEVRALHDVSLTVADRDGQATLGQFLDGLFKPKPKP